MLAPSPLTPPLTPLPRWGEGDRGPISVSGDEECSHYILQFSNKLETHSRMVLVFLVLELDAEIPRVRNLVPR